MSPLAQLKRVLIFLAATQKQKNKNKKQCQALSHGQIQELSNVATTM